MKPIGRALTNALRSFARPQQRIGSRKSAISLLFGLATASVIVGHAHFSNDDRIFAHFLPSKIHLDSHSTPKLQPRSDPASWVHRNSSPYTNLTQGQKTRIMLLEPGEGQDDLKCHLLPISSFTQVPYEALSYQWGDSSDRSYVLSCCGMDMQISRTLHAALRRLRNKSIIRAVWVDAVCINQNDLAERASQVRIMRDIYANATEVVVWLGEEEAGDESAFEELERINDDQRVPLWKNGFGWFRGTAPTSNRLSTSEFFTTTSKLRGVQYEHIVHLLCRGYFRRAWIVQELAMAKTAVLLYGEGNKQISWDMLANVVLNKLDRVVPQDILDSRVVQRSRKSIEAIERIRQHRVQSAGRPLFEVLLDTEQTQCSDVRDKIFAFLGLARDSLDNNGLEPDYEAQVAELFMKVATWDHEASGTLRMLSCCSGPWSKERDELVLELRGDHTPQARDKMALLHLPSWVPDWTRVGDASPFALYNASIPFSAGSAKTAEHSLQHDILKVRGIVVDTVDDIVSSTPRFVRTTGFYRLHDDYIEDLENVRIWVKKCKKIAAGGGLLTEDRYNLFWRAMTCELTEQALPAPDYYSSLFRKYLRHIEESPRMFRLILKSAQQSEIVHPGITLEKEADENFEDLAIIEATLARWSPGRRFFATKGGLLGQASDKTRKGDLICILYGSKIPFVLRRNRLGYEIVGECYVNGIMRGEALQNAPEKEEVFRIH